MIHPFMHEPPIALSGLRRHDRRGSLAGDDRLGGRPRIHCHDERVRSRFGQAPHPAATAKDVDRAPLASRCAADAGLWEGRLRSLSKGSEASGCEPHAALQEREACLSIGTAFDPLHLVDESFDHPVTPR